jgi:hypothetical protein
MAVTDFKNGNAASNGFIIGAINTPTRVGDRIATISEMQSIPNPWKGMLVYVEDEDLYYKVTALKSQVYGPSLTIADKIVDTYEKFDQSSGSEGGSKWIDVL